MAEGAQAGTGPSKAPARRRFIVVILVVILALGVGAFLVFGVALPFLHSLVSKDLVSESTSPDGHWTARQYYCATGAMGPAPWIVVEVVDNAGRQPTRRIAELDHTDRLRWTPDGSALRMRWISDTTLAIGGHGVDVVNGYWDH
jgi:hypothetical protein